MELTVNQIILLLQISEKNYPVIDLKNIDTYRKLIALGLIRAKRLGLSEMYDSGVSHLHLLTEEGEEMVAAIKLATKESVL